MNRDREIAERLRKYADEWDKPFTLDTKPFPDIFSRHLREAADALTAASAGHQAEVEKLRTELEQRPAKWEVANWSRQYIERAEMAEAEVEKARQIAGEAVEDLADACKWIRNDGAFDDFTTRLAGLRSRLTVQEAGEG